MWKIFNYSISLILLTFRFCHGQKLNDKTLYGLRLGVDISRPILDYLQPDRRDAEFSADLQVNNNWFAAAEGGWNNSNINNSPKLIYHSTGYFLRIGFDYNFIKHFNISDNNILFGGLRFGHSNFQHSASGFQINDSYWGNFTGSIPSHQLNANWIELVAGMKIEALKNFFIGWSLRERILLQNTIDPQLTPYVIPGFGKGNAHSAFDINYSLYYRIPFFKIRLTRRSSKPSIKQDKKSLSHS